MEAFMQASGISVGASAHDAAGAMARLEKMGAIMDMVAEHLGQLEHQFSDALRPFPPEDPPVGLASVSEPQPLSALVAAIEHQTGRLNEIGDRIMTLIRRVDL